MYLNAYSSVHQRNLFFGQFIFFKVLGLLPWTLNFSAKASRVKNTKFTVCKFSYFGTFYNISLATIAISFILYAYHQHNVNQIDSLVTRSITTNLEYLSLIVISLLLVTYTFWQKKMIKIFNEMNNIDQSLQRYAFYSSENGNVIISLIFTFNILIRGALATLGYNLPHPFFKTCLRCGTMIFYCWVMMQYTMLLDMIQKRFKFINSNIMKLGNIEEDSKLSPAFSLQRLPTQCRSALHDVINIRHTYHKLCEICEDVSEFYGLTILAGMEHNGILVTLVSYFLLVFFMGMIKLDLVSCITYGVIVVWFAF
ncbi:uncharacterized protein LOC141534923 [Cotesia typhae]|uniref:uncharacterized protein LOC141534923 n=1 Tax=Cotesia typhae TaxID=2053667 RepID=UPI003D6870A8